MIQLNLLPDVKLEYIKARQRKRMVFGTSIIISVFFLSILIALFVLVKFAQKEHITNLDKDIAAKTEDLKLKEDLDKILTIQNQLNSLPALHNQKPVTSRLFDYLVQLTPVQATISDVTLDFADNSIIIEGNSDQISTINKFVDTLKFTGYVTSEEGVDSAQKQCALQEISVQGASAEGDAKICRAFNEVVLEEFSLDGQSAEQSSKPVSYKIKLKFDPEVFRNIKPKQDETAVTLKIPNIISTRSATERPGALFVPSQDQESEGNQ